MTDDYELLPSDEIDYLRKEVEKLKEKPFGADTDTLIGSIRQLQSSIDALVKIFAEANDIVSERKPATIQNHTNNLDNNVLSKLEMQNEKIAKGMIGLSNLIKKQEENHAKEHQEFLKKKDPKPRPTVNLQAQQAAGIIPSGLSPMTNQTASQVEEKLPDIPSNNMNNNSEIPLGPESNEKILNSKGEGLPIDTKKEENKGELPEPPKPLY